MGGSATYVLILALALGLRDAAPQAAELTPATCTATAGSAADLDRDGLADACEHALAGAFAPGLVARPDCQWEDSTGRHGGDYAYAVQRVRGAFRIVYLFGYYMDCGAVTGGGGDGHSGDSEFLMVDVSYDSSSHWQTDSVFTSAHCGDVTGGGNLLFPTRYCGWWSWEVLAWHDGRLRGAPVIWTSVGKRANYVSRARCDRWLVERCDSVAYFRFPVERLEQNVGSRAAPLPWREGGTSDGCIGPLLPSPRLRQLSPDAYARRECWWSLTRRFDGWLARFGPATTPYGEILVRYAGF